MFKSLPDGTGFEGIKRSWKEAEAWPWGSQGEAFGESAAHYLQENPAFSRS